MHEFSIMQSALETAEEKTRAAGGTQIHRLRVRVAVPKYQQQEEAVDAAHSPLARAGKARRMLHLSGDAAIESTVYERDRLAIGDIITGPAIIEQFDATTVIPPGWSARVDGYRNLMLERA